jgi:hypothetical protein
MFIFMSIHIVFSNEHTVRKDSLGFSSPIFCIINSVIFLIIKLVHYYCAFRPLRFVFLTSVLTAALTTSIQLNPLGYARASNLVNKSGPEPQLECTPYC